MSIRFDRRLSRIALALSLCWSPAAAQLEEWSSPPSATFNQFLIEHTIIATVFGNTVQCYSALHKSWTVVTTAVPFPVVTKLNEHVMIQDGTTFHAYSARTGTVSSVVTVAGSYIVTPPQTWASVVVDGTDVHVFFPLYGAWTTFTVAAAPVVYVGRQAAVVSDGVDCFGISATRATIVPLGLPAVAAFSEGSVAFAASAGQLHGFAGHTGTWASTALSTPNPQFFSGPTYCGFAAALDGTQVHFFSGQRPVFRTVAYPTGSTLSVTRQVGVVVDGLVAHVFSGPQATLTSRTFASAPAVQLNDFLGMFTDSTGVVAFSAPRGSFSTPLSGSFTTLTDQGMATVKPVGGTLATQVYSSYLNQWFATPSLSPAAVTHLTGQAVAFVEPGSGIYALSSRGGAWNFLPEPAVTAVVKHTAIFTARSATAVHAFNYRTRAWRSQALAGPPQHHIVHFNTCIVTDPAAGFAYAYSHHIDRWAPRRLTGTPIIASVEIVTGYVNDSGGIHVFGGTGQLTHTGEFPDFWRIPTGGALYQIDLNGEPNAEAILAASTVPANISLPPYGTLRLDPAALVIVDTPVLDASGGYHLRLELPDVPALAGTVFYFQAVIGGPTIPYFTNEIEATLF